MCKAPLAMSSHIKEGCFDWVPPASANRHIHSFAGDPVCRLVTGPFNSRPADECLQGLVMMSDDNNPRSVYEAVVAGLPVMVSDEAQVRSGTGAPG